MVDFKALDRSYARGERAGYERCQARDAFLESLAYPCKSCK